MSNKDAIKWRNPYDPEENALYDELTATDYTGDPGMTLQAPAEEQDINVIMRRFGVKDGSRLPYWTDPGMIFGDFTEMPTDPVEAHDILRTGEIQFMMLPADIRKEFETPGNLYNWMTDPNNLEAAYTKGLLKKPLPPPEPIKVSVVSSSTSSDKEPLVPTSNS